MYVVTGAAGHTGAVIAERLLAQGKKVRVMGRSAERLSSLVSLGAEPFVADVTDKEGTARAFHGATAAYVMLPPDLANPDYAGFQDAVTGTVAHAIEAAKVGHVVALSSFGADKPGKTGPIAGTHRLEERLKQISGLNALFLRPGYFMENTLPQATVVSQFGKAMGPLKPDLKIPMIATRDIGTFAADALLKLDFTGYQTRELQGQRDLTMNEVAAVIGQAIGRPDVSYDQISNDQFRGFLVHMGASDTTADKMVEMADAQNSGYIRALESRSPANTTPTSYEDFVAEFFVPAYRKASGRNAPANS